MEGASGRLVWSIRDLRQTPLVVTIHDPEPHSGERSLRKAFVRRVTFARAQRFIVHNRAQRSLFCRLHRVAPERVDTIPLGPYYTSRFWLDSSGEEPPAARYEKTTVLFFGRLSPYKGLEDLFRAAPLVSERVPRTRFVVAGRPENGYTLPARPVLPNGGQMEVIDNYIPNRLLAQLFRQAQVVVCPYTDATQSGVVLTAYAYGKPVVATRVGGLPEYVTDRETGILVHPGSPAALADGLVTILEELAADPNAAQRYANNIGRRAQTDLAWNHIAEETAEIYEQACAGRRSAQTGTLEVANS
jgi:glycosyltransferase involved in cell wall biosynthesis